MLDANEVRARLRSVAQELGSQQALAQKAGVSPTYISDILLDRREPTDAVCAILGLERKVVYVEALAPKKKGRGQ